MKSRLFFCSLPLLLCFLYSNAYPAQGKAQVYIKPLPYLSLTLDPQVMEDTYSFHVSSQIYDTLFKFDEFINLKPNLVESYQVSDNGQVITLNLKHDVRFHNNKTLNSDDVIYTIQRFIKNANRRYPDLLLLSGASDYFW